ncbi:MAG TPA: von Willebrand factor type A domain-containing protein [Candidatus Didemnitutus sp.]|nr:von Willebrand factor type A domain-containing protein [Candidatus Didemnitutus sp.]
MKNDPSTLEKRSLLPVARENHQAGLLRYATQLLRGDGGKARDVVTATFNRLQDQPVEEIEDILPEWLFAECRRQALRIAPRDAGASNDGPDGGDVTGPDDGAESEDPLTTMRRLFDRLTPKQQEALRLHFQDGFGVKDIAFITELTPANVGTLVHNAVVRLGRELHAHRAGKDAPESKLASARDPRLSLFALGELEDRERKAFESSLVDRKAAGEKIDELRAACDLIGRSLSVDPAQVRRSRKKKKNSGGLGLWFRFPRVLAPVGALAALGFALFFFLRREEAPPATATSDVDFRLKAADWPTPAAAPSEKSRSVGAGAGASESGGHGSSTSARDALSMPATIETATPSFNAVDASNPGAESTADAATPDADDPEPLSTGPAARARGRTGEIVGGEQAARETGESTHELSEGKKPETTEDTSAPVSEGTEKKPDGSTVSPKSIPTGTAKSASEAPGEKSKKTKSQASVSELAGDVDSRAVIDLKRSLALGVTPPRDTVRIEQLLNYFPYAYAPPDGSADFAAALEVAPAPWSRGNLLVRVAIKAKEIPPPVRPSANVVLLIDTSGSMSASNRLPLVKEAARLMLDRLRPDDRVGIVTYAGESRLTLAPTPVSQARKIRSAIDRLEAGGMTNGGAGLELAYELAAAHVVRDGPNAVILCTDGDFNVGPTSESALAELIDHWGRTPVHLSIFGFGRNGRIDPRLEALAIRGHGTSGYVNTGREAEQVLAGEMNGLFKPVARDLSMKVSFNDAAVRHHELLGYETPEGDSSNHGFSRSAPAILPGQSFTALYEVEAEPGLSPVGKLLDLRLNYRRGDESGFRHQEIPLVRGSGIFRDASRDFRFATAVAALGLVLRQAPQAEGITLDQVDAWGRESLGDDIGGYRSEFLALVDQARQLER